MKKKKHCSQIWSRGVKVGQNQVFYHFIKCCLLVCLEIICHGSLQQCLTCSIGQILEKKKKKIGAQIQARNQVFCHFLKFSAFFSYSDSLQQHLTTSRGRIYEKKFWSQIWSTDVGPKTRFFTIFSTLHCYFSLKLHTVVASINV